MRWLNILPFVFSFYFISALSFRVTTSSKGLGGIGSAQHSFIKERCSDIRRQQQTRTNAVLDSADGRALKGFVRGHKCLFSDEHLRSGSLVFLLRGADSSQRYIYPLEIETNRHELPGAEAALAMFEQKDAAILAAQSATDRASNQGASDLLHEEIARYHRVLQYAVAVDEPRFMRKDVWDYTTELYDEIGVDAQAIATGVLSFKDFYKERLKSTGNKQVAACVDSLVGALQETKKYKRPLVAATQRKFEAPPEPASIFPEPQVNLYSFNLNEIPEAERAAVAKVVDHATKKYPRVATIA